jgi:hypothetical protein
VSTIFQVICKLHNICIDSWLQKNPNGALVNAEAPPFSDDDNLWNTFDITIGLDDSFDQPMDNDVLQHLENLFIRLGER